MIPRTLEEREQELVSVEIVVTKLDAARAQLHTAIDLFFANDDHISQFTLISAAHGILRDVATARGIKKSFKDSPLISDGERTAYLKAVHLPQNFFKHASSDPNGKLAFRYKLIPLYMLDAIVLWIALGQELTHPIKVFFVWLQLEFPELLCHPPAEEFLGSIRNTASSSVSFRTLGRELLRKPEASSGF